MYTVNVALGKTIAEDVKNGYFLNMDDQLKMFHRIIRSDPKLKNGFHAIGFSQVCNTQIHVKRKRNYYILGQFIDTRLY